MEKVAFIKYFSKMRLNLKRHHRVYTPSSEHTYRPMRARIASQLFYYGTSSHNIAKFHVSENPV